MVDSRKLKLVSLLYKKRPEEGPSPAASTSHDRGPTCPTLHVQYTRAFCYCCKGPKASDGSITILHVFFPTTVLLNKVCVICGFKHCNTPYPPTPSSSPFYSFHQILVSCASSSQFAHWGARYLA